MLFFMGEILNFKKIYILEEGIHPKKAFCALTKS